MGAHVLAAAGLAAALLAGCGERPAAPDAAALAARQYYDSLLCGRYAAFVGGMAGADSLPEAYLEQLRTNAKQFMARQKEEHGGISSVSVVRVDTDSVNRRRDVFLMLCYGDSAREEVVVPMVETPAGWRMR